MLDGVSEFQPHTAALLRAPSTSLDGVVQSGAMASMVWNGTIRYSSCLRQGKFTSSGGIGRIVACVGASSDALRTPRLPSLTECSV